MAQRFTSQVAIVTGGSRGIGLATAEALAREGASVVIVSLNEERGQTAAGAIRDEGGRADFICADVTQRDQVERMVARTLERFGDINILVNNAGVHDSAPFWEEPAELWERMYRVNVLGTALPSQAVVRHLKDNGGGAIVHVASKAGVVGEPGHAAYSASKGAVIALARAMAVELAPCSIRVNAVCPGPVMTDMLHAAVPTREGRDQLAADAPLGRVGRPEDIANAVLYLASSDSDWCTGQAVSIDGGLSILK
ncbi:MAG: Diacetyl reductase [(S)-acetoin forming] [Anaerolineales bacterium]|nr:Diacetyl reductase [(S)-acetoin forming] [Anaerolineales bacterium]